MNIVELAAGREMDELVAEKVMGKQITSSCTCCHGATCPRHDDPKTPAYSTNIAAAWKAAEKVDLFKNCRHLHEMRERIGKGSEETLSDWYWVVEQVFEPLDHNVIVGRGETAPLAICRAAIKVAEDLKAGEESE